MKDSISETSIVSQTGKSPYPRCAASNTSTIMNLRVEDPKLANSMYQYANESQQRSKAEDGEAKPTPKEEDVQPNATPGINDHVVEALNRSNKSIVIGSITRNQDIEDDQFGVIRPRDGAEQDQTAERMPLQSKLKLKTIVLSPRQIL